MALAPATPRQRASASTSPGKVDCVFRLYVSSTSPISARAIVNARRFLDANFAGRYKLTILDIADHVARARADQIVASPTLVRVEPQPLRRFIGDMSNDARLSAAMGLPPSSGVA
jgi:circadian clock protein KaiB